MHDIWRFQMPIPLAILIDGENISAKFLATLQKEVDKLGTPVSWQVFGDFLSRPHPEWQEAAKSNGIEVRHIFHDGGKNAADIALTVAAMDLLHARRIGGFVLVSSDSDFTALARRLRLDAIPVYGFGEAKTPEYLRSACTKFFVLELPVPAIQGPALDTAQLEIKRLREILHAACRELGTAGRVPASSASNYLKSTAPALWATVGGGKGTFLKKLRGLGLVELHGSGPATEISVKFSLLTVVR
jgi:hypothetical protein